MLQGYYFQYGDCEAPRSHICISIHPLMYCTLRLVITYAVIIIVLSLLCIEMLSMSVVI